MDLVRWSEWALQSLFDPVCAACHGRVGPGRVGPVCQECWAAIRLLSPPWCARCGEPMRSWRHPSKHLDCCARCLAHPPDFDEARAFGLYEGSLREMVHALKYRRCQTLGAPLGALMRCTDRGLLANADAVVPVPLHPWRHLRRGFNQADELARALGPRVWRPLRRWTLGVPQAGLSGDRRQTNVKGAYRWSQRRAGALRQRPRYVVLIDDVMTTGATLDACSQALREGGVEWIAALTLARAATNAGPTRAAPRPQPPRAPRPLAPHR